jgi:rubrerythrin
MDKNLKKNKQLTLNDIRILDVCRDIELTAEKLYLFFAEVFKDDGELAALWLKTAQEEKNHAHQFELAAKLKTGMVESIHVPLEEAEEMLGIVGKFLINSKKKPPSAEGALLFAVGMEEQLSKFHMDCLAIFTDESYREMFSAMMAHDKQHVEALQDAHTNFLKSV